MKFKRILASSLCFAMLGINGAAVIAEDTAENAVFYWNGEQNVNIASYYYSEGSASATYTVKDGTQVLELGGGKGPMYTFINVKDAAFPMNKPLAVAITVRYYDEGENGEYFSLRYANAVANFQEPEKVEMTNTKEFKEHTFYIDDFVFSNGNNNADLVLASWTSKYRSSPGATYIEWLKVEKSFPRQPIQFQLKSEHMGNIFAGDDEKLLNISLSNVSSVEVTAETEYEILTYDEKLITSGTTEPALVEAEGETQIPIIAEVSDYGSYLVRVKGKCRGIVDGEEKEFEIDSQEFRFSVVNKKADGEKTNYMMRSQVHMDYGGRDVYLMDMMAEMGISGSREAAAWSNNETTKGKYKETWTQEEAFRRAVSLGMNQNLAIAYSNPLYGGKYLDVPITSETIQAYANYAGHLAEKYGDIMQYYEIWNEPNLMGTGGFNYNYATPTQYAELCKATYTAVKKANPNVKIGVWSTAQIPLGWIEETMQAGILDYCDVVTIHPYDWEDKGMDNRIKNELYINRINELKELLAKYGKPDMPIVITEIGVRTGDDYASEVGQASYLTQLFAVSAGEKFVDNIYIYDFMNDSAGTEMGGEGMWGLIFHTAYTTPRAAKLSYVALAAYNKFMTDAEAVDKIVRNKTSAYRFKRTDGKEVIILWSDQQSESIGLDLGTNEIEIFDMYSNSKGTFKSSDGKYSFEATFEPQYIVGNFAKLEETEGEITINDGRQYAAPSDTAIFEIKDAKMRNLTVKATGRDNAEVVKIEGMTAGEAKVYVKTGAEAEKENAVELKLYDGEECIYSTKVHVCITEPIDFESHIEKYSENSSTRYVMSTSVTNYSNTNAITGTVSADFSDIGGGLETRKFENVVPGETVNVKINIPEQIVQRTIISNVKVELDYGYKKSKEAWLSKNIASYAETVPNISGEFKYSDWMGGDWFAADDAYAARYMTDWRGLSDCSMTGTVKWDEENMYLLAIVEDDVYCNDAEPISMWSGDGIQVALCSAEERLKSGATFSEIGISKLKKGDTMWRYETQNMYNNATSNLKSNVEPETGECSVEYHGGKYIYRARIPWAEFFGKGTTMAENQQLGFSILANDNDGNGRKGWVEYCSGIGSGKAPAKYGLMTLVK